MVFSEAIRKLRQPSFWSDIPAERFVPTTTVRVPGALSWSEPTGQFYTGHTASIPARRNRHEQGLSPSTKGRGPWELVYQEEFETRAEAMRRERELKTGKGRDELKRLFSNRAT